MKKLAFILILLSSPQGRCEDVLPRTMSPDGSCRIVRQKNPHHEADFFIQNIQKKTHLGQILKGKEITNVNMVACWSPDSSKVALVIYYGTRGVGIWVYEKAPNRQFKQVEFTDIDLNKLVPAELSEEPGYPICIAGPWINNEAVRLSYGQDIGFAAKETYYFTNVILTIHDGKGVLSEASHLNGLSSKEGNKFLQERRRYWDLDFKE